MEQVIKTLRSIAVAVRQFVRKCNKAPDSPQNRQVDKTHAATPRDNLSTLHCEEERLHVAHLEQTAKDNELRDHIHLIREAMNMIFTLTHDHINRNDDELVMQYFGIRLFNTMASSIRLSHAGYYQGAFSCLRDFLETYFLVDYFGSFPEQIQLWKAADEKQLRNEFGPGAIRNALDTRDGFKEKNRKKTYDLISHYATHATPGGFHLVTINDLGKIGPFQRPAMFTAWMQEAVKMACNSGLVLGRAFKDVDASTSAIKANYLADLKHWQSKYLPNV
ncbi:hypothetical protein [Tardiphaga sp. OK245]|uniref:hypothetical protein n=1 Tax=Tardiphaga sp. OK245 TaxID=1855306 RepID=UPI0008A7DF84|nr:hypothetical protein [Tardiphaga sp. OK245]SEH43065.1 hypothetical protein SAMN05216367_0228 [Tardiphaga sp. OK245]